MSPSIDTYCKLRADKFKSELNFRCFDKDKERLILAPSCAAPNKLGKCGKKKTVSWTLVDGRGEYNIDFSFHI